MKLYDTLSKSLKSVDLSKDVSVYTCGPTVYLTPHIGNWRTFIMYDTLVRILRYSGATVQHVLNITDVGHLVHDDDDEGDDKLQKQAAKERISAQEIAKKYETIFREGMQQLNIETPDHTPRATEYIDAQIALIQTLEEKGFTYQISDGVYFDTSLAVDYGKLAGATSEALQGRIARNQEKKNPQDFALWKFSPTNVKRDMEWDSPWGIGFPGWHVECSAMAKQILGDTITIHAGGVDHIPIHHTNEIAQSEAANGVPFAEIWLHGEFINSEGKKMSKSLGNVFTLDDIVARDIDPLAYRLLVLQGKYSTETSFSWDLLESAKDRLIKYRAMAQKRWQQIDSTTKTQKDDIKAAKQSIENHLADNLNTPAALATLEGVHDIVATGLDVEAQTIFKELLITVDELLGLDLITATPDISAEIKQDIDQLQKFRANKEYQAADTLKEQLFTAHSISIEITANGVLWSKDTTD